MKDNVEIFAHDTSETGIANNYVVHDFRNDQRFRGKNQLKLKGFFSSNRSLCLNFIRILPFNSKYFVKSHKLH